MLARLGQRLRMIARTKLAARDIQIATLLEQFAKLVRQVMGVEVTHSNLLSSGGRMRQGEAKST